MADTLEDLLEPLFSRSSSSSSSSALAEVRRVVQHQDQRLVESVNAGPALKERTAAFMVLPERSVTGFQLNNPQTITVVEIDGLLVEKYTAYDFLLMRHAAKKANISLLLTTAFRSMAEQTRIYNERYTDGVVNAIGLVKGPAAKPGLSNHQMGKALDIQVGLTVAALKAGSTTATYLWLLANAELYGFKRTVAKEPWHWEHTEDRIVGPSEDVDTYQTLVNAGVVAPLAVDDGRTNLAVYTGRELYDRTRGWMRSLEMSTSTRSAIFAAQGEDAAFAGGRVANLVAQIQKADNEAGRERPAFSKPSLSPLEYDFETGTWGDNEVI